MQGFLFGVGCALTLLAVFPILRMSQRLSPKCVDSMVLSLGRVLLVFGALFGLGNAAFEHYSPPWFVVSIADGIGVMCAWYAREMYLREHGRRHTRASDGETQAA